VRQVATLVQADWLYLLTDVPALYTSNPSTDPSARPIREVHDMGGLDVRSSCCVRRRFANPWGTDLYGRAFVSFLSKSSLDKCQRASLCSRNTTSVS